MQKMMRLKKWTGAVALTGLCVFTTYPGSFLCADEATPLSQIKSTSTPTEQPMPSPVLPPSKELRSTPTTTEPSRSSQIPPAAGQAASAPTPTNQFKPMPSPEKKDIQGTFSGAPIFKGETLTLSRCIEIAQGKNPTIIAAVNTVDISRSRVGEARANYYPQVSASGSYNRITSNPALSASGVRQEYDQYSGSIDVNQTLFDFGKTWSSVKISKYNLDSSRSDLAATQDTITLNVKQAYYAVLQAKRNRDVAADIIKQFELHLEQARGFYEVGTKAKIDVIKAEVDLSNAKLSLINTENALKIAWVNLNNAMGVPDPPEYSIEDNLLFVPYAITLEEATVKAFDNRPDLKSIVSKRQAAEENISLQRSGYYPVLSANASYTWGGFGVLPDRFNNGWNAGVAVSVPLFSGFLTSHQVAEAKSNLYVLRANEESIRQQILLDVRQAYLNLHAADSSITTTDLALKQAKENLDLANGRYAAGVGSPIEVSDAFATYITAQANYTGALYNYKIAQANMEKAMGAR